MENGGLYLFEMFVYIASGLVWGLCSLYLFERFVYTASGLVLGMFSFLPAVLSACFRHVYVQGSSC